MRRNIPTSSKKSFSARAAHAKARREFVEYDTSPIRPPKSKKPMYVAISVAVAIVILVVVLLVTGCALSDDNKGSLDSSQSATITVESGDTAKAVAQKFVDAGLIKDASKFLETMQKAGADSSMQPGEYTFSGKTEPESMANSLKYGYSDKMPTVTVVEGYTLKAIASALESASSGQILADDFIEATNNASEYASDYTFLSEVGSNSLEGFLFPKTYEIETNDTARSMAIKMLDQFKSEVSNLNFSYPTGKGLSFYDTIKLASIVEKECSGDGRGTVAGIFYNRLGSSSPYLQSDATTAYVVGHDPTGEEVHADDEYSTYSNAGLPPTPICSPSLNVIKSTLDPEETDYMFFYTNSDGSYAFSKTYEEHQQAIAADN